MTPSCPRHRALRARRLVIPRLLALACLVLAPTLVHSAEPSLPYTVRHGDKLIALTRDLLARPGDWAEVARFNALRDPNLIWPGQTVNIPIRLLKSQPVNSKVVSLQGQVLQDNSPAVMGGPVGEGSRLQTGPNSSAVIELSDGSRIQLMPGSVAEVIASRDYAMRASDSSNVKTWFSGAVRLSQGAVETIASKLGLRATPLQIQTPLTIIGVRGTHFRVAQESASPTARAEVLEGQVRADNTAQQSGADLPKGTGAVIDPTRKDVTVVPLLPAPDLAVLPAELTSAQAASWPLPALPGATAFRVQVAADRQFERIVRDQKLAAATVDLSSLPIGTWQVRVRGIDAQSIEGYDSAKQLTVRLPDHWHATGSRLSLRDGRTQLAWTGQSATGQPVAAATFAATVATDAQLTQVVFRPSGSAPLLDLGPLKPGVYHVRLSATQAGGSSTDSALYRLVIPAGWGTSVLDVESALQPAGP